MTALAIVALLVGVVLFIWPGLVIAARNAAHRRMTKAPPSPKG